MGTVGGFCNGGRILVDREFQTISSRLKYKDKDVPMSHICSAVIQHKPFLLSFFSYYAAFVSFAFPSVHAGSTSSFHSYYCTPRHSLHLHSFSLKHKHTHIPTIYVCSYSTLVPGLIPSQSSFPSTFSALGLTYICTSYVTPIPIFSSLSNQAEPFFPHLYNSLHDGQTLLLTDIHYSYFKQCVVRWFYANKQKKSQM